MDDLAAFLRARLDEDEAHAQKDLWAVARSTAQGDWDALYGYNVPHSYIEAPAGSHARIAEFTSHRASPPLADGEEDLHAADVLLAARMVRAAKSRAERVLREVAAKRAILADSLAQEHFLDDGEWYGCAAVSHHPPGQPTGRDCTCGRDEEVERRLRLLAAIYSDHPGYRQEWAP